MARTTAFAGAIIARMIARGDLRAIGLRTPEQAITGQIFHRLVSELALLNIRFELRTEHVDLLRGGSGRGS